MKLHPKFVVDSKGRKTAVILPIKEFDELLEMIQDGIDHELIDDVKGDERIPWIDVKAKRKKSLQIKLKDDLVDVRQNIDKYLEALREGGFVLNAVYLFGSYADGREREGSDIDLAIVSETLPGHPINDRVRLMKYRRNIDLRIEPQPFRPKDFDENNPWVGEIIRTGIRIV